MLETITLATVTPTPMLAVKEVARARRFYEDVLGLTPVANQMDDILQYRAGELVFVVYPSQFAGTNRATALTWTVGDQLESSVEALKAKGVTFEHYQLPDTVRKGDIHVSGQIRNAWFKDPDGNIHALSNR
ncbi:MAG TPA: VOC family protein [Gemmatimonadales bacterium]|jgi:catechol 2,3-dioxygenase-like lactoylglutathione lyase family enzyme